MTQASQLCLNEGMSAPVISDPAKTYERCFIRQQEELDLAAVYESKGWPHAAKIARRRAAGCKATMTRIRRLYWGGS